MLMPVKRKNDINFQFLWSKGVQVHGVAKRWEIKKRF